MENSKETMRIITEMVGDSIKSKKRALVSSVINCSFQQDCVGGGEKITEYVGGITRFSTYQHN